MLYFYRNIFKLSSIFILCVTFNISFGQFSEDFYFSSKKDTVRINKLLIFAKKLKEVNPDSALYFFKIAEKESIKVGDNNTLMISYYNQAYILFRNSQHREALSLFQKTLLLSKKLQNEYYLYSSKTYIGTIYLFLANYNLALENNIEALSYFERVQDYNAVSGIYLNLTFIQIEQKDYDKALGYTQLSYKYAIKAVNKVYISKSLLNFGELYFIKGEYKKAITFYKRSIKIAEENNSKLFLPTIKLNIGSCYLQMNMPDSAEIYIKSVINNEINPYIKSLAYLSFCELNEYNKDYNQAIKFAFLAYNLAEIAELNGIRKKSNDYLAKLYALKGNYKKAYEYKLVSEKINDSIFSEEKYRIQNELESVYENSKKKIKIEELSKEKEINEVKAERFEYVLFFLLFIILIIVLTGSLIFRQNKLKAKHDSIELEQKLLRLQMNPHFIFNSISSIQDFILENNPLEACSYLSDFASLMRATLTNSSDNFIPLSKEIETTEHYLKLQHLRLYDKFEYEIFISDKIDIEDYSVPPMLMQPFIENSIIHGVLKKKTGKGIIKLSYSLNKGNLILETSDNGIGRELSKQSTNSKHKSKAIDITNQRIKLLSNKYKKKINFEIIDLQNNNKPTGTLVRFTLPVF